MSNEAVEYLVNYFDKLLSKDAPKPIEDFTESEIELESDLVFNYLKVKNETYGDLIDALESLANKLADRMYKEEENKNHKLASSYGIVITTIILSIIQKLQEEMLRVAQGNKD